MVESPTTAEVSSRLSELTERLRLDSGFAEVVAALKAGHGATLGGVWGSRLARLAAAALADETPRALLIVCPRPADIDPLCDDMALFTSRSPERFPAWETSPGEGKIDDDIHGDRLRVLKLLAASETQASLAPRPSPLAPALVVTSIQSLMQPVPSPELLARQTRRPARRR